MSTLGLVLRAARQQLAETLSLETSVAALEAQALLARTLNQSRAYLLANPELVLDAAAFEHYTQLLQRRSQGEPMAYILGRREFYGLDFQVTPAVLIPRPETELLVELALAQMPQKTCIDVLDLGTGSGAIALTLAKLRPQAQITAVDISLAALMVAQQNAQRFGIQNIRFVESNWFQALTPGCQYDLIVSNPPYVADDDPHLQQGDVRFEPKLALQSGIDGLSDIRHIAQTALSFIRPRGQLLFEHGYNQQDRCQDLLRSLGYIMVNGYKDLAGLSRVSSGKRN